MKAFISLYRFFLVLFLIERANLNGKLGTASVPGDGDGCEGSRSCWLRDLRVQHRVLTAVSARAAWALEVQLSTEQEGHGGSERRSNLAEVTQQDDHNPQIAVTQAAAVGFLTYCAVVGTPLHVFKYGGINTL